MKAVKEFFVVFILLCASLGVVGLFIDRAGWIGDAYFPLPLMFAWPYFVFTLFVYMRVTSELALLLFASFSFVGLWRVARTVERRVLLGVLVAYGYVGLLISAFAVNASPILPLCISAYIYLLLRGREQSRLRSACKAYLWTALPLAAFYLLLTSASSVDFATQYKHRCAADASKITNGIRGFRSGVLASLSDGRTLPLDSFGIESPVMSNDIAPYMDRSFYGVLLLISADTDLGTIHSPDAMPPQLYVGFRAHYRMEEPMPSQLKDEQKPEEDGTSYRNGVVRELANRARDVPLYKNARGELYDGGDTILMKVF